MTIHVRLFAQQAQACGLTALSLDLPDGSTVANALAVLRAAHPELPWPQGTMTAINQQYAALTDPMKPNEELAIIPPVSGG